MTMSGENSDDASILGSQLKHGTPMVYLKESDVFGARKPGKPEWLEHSELYIEISKTVDASHILGLQKIRGMWRIYVKTLEDKVKLMTNGVLLRGKKVSVLNTNPDRLDGEFTTRVRIKNIPLSSDDELIKRVLTLKGCEVVTIHREKLRINGTIVNCETGDRLVEIKTSTLKDPLPRFMTFGFYNTRVIHRGQPKPSDANKDTSLGQKSCTKCFLEGHTFSSCPNDFVCRVCKKSGHKMSECPFEDKTDTSSESGESVTSVASNDESASVVEASAITRPSSPSTSSHNGMGRGALFQRSIDDFLGSGTAGTTPNIDKPKLVLERSPITPPDEYRANVEKKKHKKHQKNK